ncbi:nucleoside hydrolase [Sinorhizobium meliloti]|uniref:nucleoside hydrolase n=1 Tax=Rhizobium meliloti TaxID=382 RepID=UPI000FD6FBA7|nr:nucleoside hydrolase [Sinorhizobium meliloti]MDW9587641.1 nucleoside hydrolase [Sinorhizobium meliloti]MDW9852266.1 nucleoside hydrolase [Sinorhizobium meliloti]MDW9870511.1 nucleoside hydrolase [Sinorhizobium meliloti]MDW9883154.1 nucleoside hydrolase [Sinorhizobium meliloti]MDX0205323.1 nucleoside hydrolase [Sinorhizobium meliloti]
MSRFRVIIDADPGVDDAAAILMALASPEIDVLGLSIVAGNVPLQDTLTNACKIVGVSGRNDVSIHAGAAGPLVRDQVFGRYARIGSFSDELVPHSSMVPAEEHAVRFIVRLAREAAEAGDLITICAIGPMTNIALALVQHPDVARGIGQIVSMGGAFTALGHRTPWAEFNVLADPHAAEIVYRSGVPIVVMPLDLTFQALFTAEHFKSFGDCGAAAGCALCNLFSTFDRSDVARFGRPGGPIHDAMTIAWLIRPELFASRKATVGTQVAGLTMGYTYADFHRMLDRPPNATVVTNVDEAGFINLLIERISLYGSAVPDSKRCEA